MTTTEELIKWDVDHVVHPGLPIGQPPGKIFEKGKGVILQDTEGKEYIDFCAQLNCVNLGYGHSELIATAAEQMQKLSYCAIFHGFSNIPSIECAKKLAELTPEGLNHSFFTAGGAESVEVALALAHLYWRNKGVAGKYKIISLYDSYHGMTIGTRSCSGTGKGLLEASIVQRVPGFIHIPPYYCYRCMLGKEYPECGIQCARFLAEVIEKEGARTVAAFLAEPVLGPAGMAPPPPEYWPMVREICTKYDVLLVTDEVTTGFCRTGKMFAVEHWGIKPDIMTIAKGITSAYFPVGAAVISDEVYDGLKGGMDAGYTYGGHPVGLAVATKAMEIYLRDKIADHVVKVSEHLIDRLNNEFLPLPCVGNVNGLGLMGGIEIVADKTTKRVFDPALNIMDNIKEKALENGLFLRVASIGRALSDRIMWICPLVITVEEVDRALDILKPIIADLKPS